MLESQIAQAILRDCIERLPTDLSLAKSIAEIKQVYYRLEVLSAETEKHLAVILKCPDQATIMQARSTWCSSTNASPS